MKNFGFVFVLLLSGACTASNVFAADANNTAAAEVTKPQPLKGFSFKALQQVPVLNGGRLKPFDEYARESILTVTGGRSYENWKPSELILSWILEVKTWGKVPLIKINREEVKKQLLLPLDRSRFSVEELMMNPAFLQYAELDQSGGGQVVDGGVSSVTNKKDPRQQELQQTISRVSFFLSLARGENLFVTPKPEPAVWGTLAEGMKTPSPQSESFHRMLKAYLDQDANEFSKQSNALLDSTIQAIPGYQDQAWKIKAEVIYNQFRPFLQAMIFYLIAGILWMFAAPRTLAVTTTGMASKSFSFGVLARLMAKVFTIIGFAVHTIGFALRSLIAGRPPVSNMYESVIWVCFGVLIFAFILYARFRNKIILATATLSAGLVLFAADSAPVIMDPTIHPLVAVLRSNYWLTVHVLTITLSYAAFMLAAGIANVNLFQFVLVSRKGASMESSQKITNLNQLAYRSLQMGTVLLAAGTILGGVWADASWGRFWGWDPKEVWALIALLTYMAVLHGRFTGWIGVFTFPIATAMSFATVVMSWYGVNFILGTGKHSYGFSSGGQGIVGSLILVQLAYCLWVWMLHKRTSNAAA